MKYCLGCRRANPSKSLYCTGCGCMLGLRACEEGHENPLEAQFCATCGSAELVEGSRCLKLGCVTVLVNALFASLLLWMGWLVFGGWLTSLARCAFCFLYCLAGYIYAYTVLFSIAYLLFPEEWRKQIRALLGFWLKVAHGVMSGLGKFLAQLLKTRKPPNKQA